MFHTLRENFILFTIKFVNEIGKRDPLNVIIGATLIGIGTIYLLCYIFLVLGMR